jgi:hypothetical protein
VILCVCDVRSVLEHPGEPARGYTISVWMFLSGVSQPLSPLSHRLGRRSREAICSQEESSVSRLRELPVTRRGSGKHTLKGSCLP